MSNSGAWFGDHYEQLSEMYETIVKSEKMSGRDVTLQDEIRIRTEISDAYDEVIRCFEKENADPSIITYTINLMKSTVASSNDLRNIAQLAASISQSTIGALFLVNELQEAEKEKNSGFNMEYILDDKENKNQEELTAKIDIRLDNAVIEALCSEKNEDEYSKLNKRAMAGDKNAIIVVDLIRKSIHYMHAKENGSLLEKGKDLGALALVDKLVSTGESIAVSNAEQLIKVFELEKYDIYTADENGKKLIDVDKVREEFKKKAEKNRVAVNPNYVKGLNTEVRLLDQISQRYDEKYIKFGTISGMISDIREHFEISRFIDTARILSKEDVGNPNIGDNINQFVANNPELSQKALVHGINYFNEFGSKLNQGEQYYKMLSAVATSRKMMIGNNENVKKLIYSKLENSYSPINDDEKRNTLKQEDEGR